jgi:multicomponent Na+:H+ antiporter subunit E
MQRFGASPRVAAALFTTWVVLSGKFDGAHLGAGAVTAIVLAVATDRLWALPPPIGMSGRRPLHGVRWGRGLLYVVWLAKEVVVSGLQVAYVVLHPRLPVGPRLVRFRAELPHTLARLTLANSITLTPGTVTLEVEGDEFLVHALTPIGARGIEEGTIRRRVVRLFDLDDRDRRAGEGP